jgi:chaperonin GroES
MTEIKTRPAPTRVLVKPVEVDDKTKGGLFIPGTAKPKPDEGVVVAIGSAVEFVAIGDRVVYNKGAGVDIQENGVDYLIFRESDIYAIR